MPVETQYFRSDQHTINGLLAYQLKITQTTIYDYFGETVGGWVTVYWGIRVWKRSSAGVETEITAGTPVAQVYRDSEEMGIQSNTWNCPSTSLVTTDAIVVRIYMKMGAGDWILKRTFITEQLSATVLDAVVWTVYYQTYYYYDSYEDYTSGTFYHGTSTYNSRIENFSYTTIILKTVTDNIALTDTLITHKQLIISDTVGLSDIPLKGGIMAVTDNIGLTDALKCHKTIQISDNITLTEVLLKHGVIKILDSVVLSDLVVVLGITHKFHIPMIRLMVRPLGRAIMLRGAIPITIRKSYMVFEVQKPVKGGRDGS